MFKDLKGKRFSRLVVLELVSAPKQRTKWKCKCDCGKETNVFSSNLIRGFTESCGCRLQEVYFENRKEFGEAYLNSLFTKYKYEAKKANREFLLLKEEFKILISSNCFYCGSEPTQLKKFKDLNGTCPRNGIDRVNNEIGYEKSNCVSCCTICNKMKIHYSKEFFLDHVKKIYDNTNLKSVVSDRAR